MNIDDLLSSPFSFKSRKIFIPCETRPLWKASIVILIIGLTGREKRCSLRKVHTANWLTKSKNHLEELIDWTKSVDLFPPNIRMDPFIDKAIDLIAASGYVYKTGGKIELTAKGEKFFSQLEADSDLMKAEKSILKDSKKYLSEAAIERIFKANQ